MAPSAAPPQWIVELNSPPPKPAKSAHAVPDPPGYTAAAGAGTKQRAQQSKAAAVRKPPTAEETDTLKLKKAWEVAIAPAKQLPMNAIGA